MNRNSPIALVLVFLTASSIAIIHPVKASENFWVTKAPMPKAEIGLGAAGVNGKVYAFGGDGTNEEYDPVMDTWSAKTPVPTPRYGPGVATWKNIIYVIGGSNGNRDTGVNEA
ncbi:MAG TPA: hypothetical protein VJ066_05655, partial [Candidatus Bathyarchaeia archaeon]|nr:hypothetical protein [Candidatus Bathyarchaeia archaeon]